MKDAIKEYLDLTETQKRELWKNAVFVFDTNIFLNLYRYTEVTRESLLRAMQQLSDRIWMPKQVAQELMKDRTKVILDTLKIFDELKEEKDKFIKDCREKLRREAKDVKIDNMSKEIDKHIEILMKESNYIEKLEDDKILNQLLQLFEKKVGNGFTETELEEIKRKGIDRYSKQIPPGYKDFKKGEENNAFGDLIIWKEILSFAKSNKKDIIYVTGDQKEDWWNRVKGRTLGPRVELRKEFWEETNRNFHMYSMNGFLIQFKELQGTQIQQSAIDEVKNYERLTEENRRRIMHEQARRYETERLAMRRHHLTSMLHNLTQKQEAIERNLSEAEQALRIKKELLDSDITEVENLGRFFEDMKREQACLEDIIRQKTRIQKEMEELDWRRTKFMDLNERSEKDFDQL